MGFHVKPVDGIVGFRHEKVERIVGQESDLYHTIAKATEVVKARIQGPVDDLRLTPLD
jgi:hypothetical protein